MKQGRRRARQKIDGEQDGQELKEEKQKNDYMNLKSRGLGLRFFRLLSRTKVRAVHLLGVLVLGLIALVAFVRWLEPRFAFFPSAGETTTPQELGVAFSATTVPTSDGERLRVWHLRSRLADGAGHAPRALIVYFHGNGGNLSMWAPILADLARRGDDIVAFDYRGYGVSSGRPTESGLYRDADAIVDHVWALPGESRPIVYWGRSLGTAVAAYAATRRAPDGIIIESGFPDARSIVRSDPLLAFLSLFASYRFPTAAFLARTGKPTLVVHGDADQIIPFALGKRLFDSLKGEKRFVAVRGGDHNDAQPADPSTYWNAIDTFVRDLPVRRPDL